MGADISVGFNRGIYPVEDVVGESWVIHADGKQVVVSAVSGPLDVKVVPALKLAESGAEVRNLVYERAYAPNTDPSKRMAKAAADAENLNSSFQASVASATNVAAQTAAVVGALQTRPGTQPDPVLAAVARESSGHAAQIVDAAEGAPGSTNVSTARIGPSGYDAVEVSFTVSSSDPIGSSYVVLVARFVEKGAPRNAVRTLVYSRNVGPIGPSARQVHLLEGGFPPDFELKDVQAHLYSRGIEVPTSVSPKRVILNASEAFEYIKMEYLGSHRTSTLPPTPAMGTRPADLPVRLADGEFKQSFFVIVSESGAASGFFTDASCTTPLRDAYVQGVLSGVKFKPALRNGKPVEGVAEVRLGEIPF